MTPIKRRMRGGMERARGMKRERDTACGMCNPPSYIPFEEHTIAEMRRFVETPRDGGETCGVFNVAKGKGGIQYLRRDPLCWSGSVDDSGRKYCTVERGVNHKYSWHTHPATLVAGSEDRSEGSKFYPSVEDFFNLIKHTDIQYSYIFTIFGYWILYYGGNSSIPREGTKYIRDKIVEENDKLHAILGGGRMFERESVRNYIATLLLKFRKNHIFRMRYKIVFVRYNGEVITGDR
jgi:hypothetical protein